jgi:hypothetical protein
MREINISINDSFETAKVMINNEGIKKIKNVSFSDLIKELNSHVSGFNSGILPRGVKFIKEAKEYTYVAIETLPNVKTFNYYNGSKNNTVNMPFPPLLFIFKVNGNKIIDVRVFALSNTLLSFNDTLYSFPFGNIYNDGRVCWGSAKIDFSFKSYLHLLSIMATFLGSSFNGDLFIKGAEDIGGHKIDSFLSLVGALKDKPEFPISYLVNSGNTIKKLTQ